MVVTVKGLATNSIQEQPQHTIAADHLHHAPKIFKEDTIIDWTQPAVSIHNFIRGLSPYPAAHTTLAGKSIKIFESEAVADLLKHEPGTYETDHATYLRFAAIDNYVGVKELQQEGKKRMKVVDFLRGFRG